MPSHESVVGLTFNQLTVISEFKKENSKKYFAICKCQCGNEHMAAIDKLKDGTTKSCGCWNQEQRKARAKNLIQSSIKYNSPAEASASTIFKRRFSEGNLTFEQFLDFTKKDCFYCGAKPSNMVNSHKADPKASIDAKENGDYIYNSLRKIDFSKGYDFDNVITCCKNCMLNKRFQKNN